MKVGLSPILLLTLSPNWVLKLEKMTSLEKYCGQCIYFRLKYAANNFHTPDITTIKRNKNNQALFPKSFICYHSRKTPYKKQFSSQFIHQKRCNYWTWWNKYKPIRKKQSNQNKK